MLRIMGTKFRTTSKGAAKNLATKLKAQGYDARRGYSTGGAEVNIMHDDSQATAVLEAVLAIDRSARFVGPSR